MREALHRRIARRTLVALVLVAGVSTLAVEAQQRSDGNDAAAQLPPTNFSAEDGASGLGLSNADVLNPRWSAAPGFAYASLPSNSLHPDAQAIGDASCKSCHTLEAEHFSHTIHSQGMEAAKAAAPDTPVCEACHGPGSVHAERPLQAGTIIGFTHGSGTQIEDQTGACLGCHVGGPRDHWLGSVHQQNQLSCSDCHNPMAKFSAQGLMAKQSISETCATCHRDIRVQFNRRSHMPLPEGELACDDCHNPHGSMTAPLLKTATVNETCYQCHAEKRGPFLFEHAPVRDSCLNCHTPHGSNQHALLVAPIPFLCQQCHSHTRHPNDLQLPASLANGQFPDERLIGRGCITCHAQIHGSNHPSGPRMHK